MGTSLGEMAPSVEGMQRVREHPTLLQTLARLGVGPGDIDTVCHSHIHPHHISGNVVRNTEGSEVPAFPEARHVMQAAEYSYCASSNYRRVQAAFDRFVAPVETSGQLDLVDGEVDLIRGEHGSLTLMPVPGPTPGHMVMRIQSEGHVAYPVSYTHLRAHETPEHLVCRLLLEKKKKK
eukprot:TRINITY_DN50446_c0_g1_i2.p1 TRINITY_DN50446_c0_g1~~TRINITY_DN50446_c0_g1_i2.p1  ORF type:complete len:178 (+),score=43.26 TRINITY_DN50446_c0_g1_i2:252-785(+)